ncbi:recombination protein NinB [Delftia sp. RIT313]|uniref:recombination protein NinB n=1 Tax=Delftia sp. RIT313 TaxID=1468410 RepID=UPI00044B420F|nr:recombination protein NinB [Delftia sp. RIT313]EZP51415.1 NinB protein [Delftia sp. RIT313]
MTDRLEIELFSRQQAWVAIKGQLFPFLKDVLQGSGRWVLTVTRRKRTKAQNKRYWGQGVLAQVAAQAVVNGKQYDAETWHEMFKRLFIGVVELPNGEVVGKSSADLTTAEFSEFCTRVEAYAASELGVTFYDLWEGK